MELNLGWEMVSIKLNKVLEVWWQLNIISFASVMYNIMKSEISK